MGITVNKIIQRVASFYPNLKKDIRIAQIKESPQDFIYRNLKFSLLFSMLLTILFFFIVKKSGLSLVLLPLGYIIFFFVLFNFTFLKLRARIIQRQKEIDREVLFAGRHLLIKLYSGKPLLNALIDTSKSHGVAAKYLKEIVDDIDTGSSLENALKNAMLYSPSEKFRKVLFHINNTLNLGINIAEPLSDVLDEISKEQELEIKRYGKKLNTIVIFYMLAAIVIPSIGMTVFIAFSSFIRFTVDITHFAIALIFIIFIQALFISIFKSIRPTVNI